MLQKNPFNFYFSKVKQFHGNSVTNQIASAKKLEGEPNTPPPRLPRVERRLNYNLAYSPYHQLISLAKDYGL